MSKVLINDVVGIQTSAAGSGLQVDTPVTFGTDTTISGNTTLNGTFLTMAGVTQTGGRRQIIKSGTTLTSANSGAVLIPAGSAQTFTLPAPAEGLHFKMHAASAAAHKLQVSSGAKIYGIAININNEIAAAAEGQVISNVNSVAFGVALKVGDFMEVVCDGSNWYLYSVTNDPLTTT